MDSMIKLYVLCCIITTNLTFIWFNTACAQHLIGRFFVKDHTTATFDELMDAVDAKSNFLGELFSCPLCFGTWMAMFASFFMTFSGSASSWFIPACTFSCPVISYVAGGFAFSGKKSADSRHG